MTDREVIADDLCRDVGGARVDADTVPVVDQLLAQNCRDRFRIKVTLAFEIRIEAAPREPMTSSIETALKPCRLNIRRALWTIFSRTRSRCSDENGMVSPSLGKIYAATPPSLVVKNV
jgi:hypothetical protein